MQPSRSQIAALAATTFAVACYLLLKRHSGNSVPSLINQNKYTTMTDKNLPRGYRNNNPCNIRYNAANPWRGKIYPNTDGSFEQFDSLENGYRAALALLRGDGYIGKGLNTIDKIITKFAPADDNNDTQSYINFVSNYTGIPKDKVISRNDKNSLINIVYAMSLVENNTNKAVQIKAVKDAGLPNIELVKKGWNLL